MNDYKNTNGLKIKMEVPLFMAYTTQEGGYLPNIPEAHALMYYAMHAVRMKAENPNIILLDDQAWPEENFAQLFRGTANWYGVDPNEMIKLWPFVDKQFDALNFPRLQGPERFQMRVFGLVN